MKGKAQPALPQVTGKGGTARLPQQPWDGSTGLCCITPWSAGQLEASAQRNPSEEMSLLLPLLEKLDTHYTLLKVASSRLPGELCRELNSLCSPAGGWLLPIPAPGPRKGAGVPPGSLGAATLRAYPGLNETLLEKPQAGSMGWGKGLSVSNARKLNCYSNCRFLLGKKEH